MRRLFAFFLTSFDGYTEGPAGEFDWPVVDDEFNRFSAEQLDAADTLLFGRRTYDGMASYWPTAEAGRDNPALARRMNGTRKLVASTTLSRADWADTEVLAGDVPERVREVKASPGADIALLGSGTLTATLLEAHLVDELRVLVCPVLLGAGRPLLSTLRARHRLELDGTRTFDSGNVLLAYRTSDG